MSEKALLIKNARYEGQEDVAPFAMLSLLQERDFCLNPQARVRHGVETMVQSPLQQQFLVCATLHKTPLIEHDDPVSVLHR